MVQHRWRANEDGDVLAYGGKDNCLACGAMRRTPESGPLFNLATGPCPAGDEKIVAAAEAETAREMAEYTLTTCELPSDARRDHAYRMNLRWYGMHPEELEATQS